MVYQSDNSLMDCNALIINLLIQCDVYRIGSDMQVDFDRYGDIDIGFSVQDLDVPDDIADFISMVDWKGRRVFPVVVSGGMCGNCISRVRKLTVGARAEDMLIIRYGKRSRITKDEDIMRWANKVRKAVGLQPLA